MTEPLDHHERIRIGRSAQEVLQNETINLAIDRLIADYENAWRDSPFDAADLRELAYRRRGALVDVKAELQKLVDDGTAAAAELKALQDEAEGKRQFT